MGGVTHVIEQTAVTDGVLIVMKEAGWTSHDVVAKIRTLLGGVKVGHAGTLDPAATGVLPVLIGRATRVAEYLVEWDKEYHAVMRLGETTDTQDATGTVLTRVDTAGLLPDSIYQAVIRFQGAQRQMPPMYSAVKIGGRPLYKAARAGETVERQTRPIVVHALDVLAIEGRDITLKVICSKGTYIRTLCADIGQALGLGGHLHALERRRVGPLSIEKAMTIDQIAAELPVGNLYDHMITLDQVLETLPFIVVTDEQAKRVLHGAPILADGKSALSGVSKPASVRLKDERGRLLAIGSYDGSAGQIRIQKVFAEIESLN